MPELDICIYCKNPIRPDKEEYVKVEPGAQDSRNLGKPQYQQYAHAKCYEQMNALEQELK